MQCQGQRAFFPRCLASLRNFAGPSGPAFSCAGPEGHSHTSNGAVDSEASLGRDLAVGLCTFEIACNAWTHTAEAAGSVTLLETSTVVARKEIDLRGSAESCHNVASPNGLIIVTPDSPAARMGIA